MKLASKKNHTPDGVLYVVSCDLKTMVAASEIAPTMRYALDHWSNVASELALQYEKLNNQALTNIQVFDSKQLTAPLPRATQWLDGSAYVNHVELARKSRGASMPDSFWHEPLMYQGVSDNLLGPCDSIVGHQDWGIDFEAELVVITDDVPAGCSVENAAQHIRLITLCNDISLRNLIAPELQKGFGFVQSKPASAFGPVAVTPDEISDYWHNGQLHLPMLIHLNSRLFGQPDCGTDMVFSFLALIAHAAKTRHLGAGTLIGSGTISNRDSSKGTACLVEKRVLETLATGKPITPWLTSGDKVTLEIKDHQGHSIWGQIDQKVKLLNNGH
ncbi:MAG: fumarylacetoacetate hydrolase family protein [Endozoicomonas sp. (ex Botrylloides leachii)]|nr:fumarylacetoacetate hydrolase family protein [Endozoicomonas sp. (ex Botrylloides leachii)]